jgi:Protein of Unknown function (DUF2784)
MPMQSVPGPETGAALPARGLARFALLAADRGLYLLHLSTTTTIIFGWIPPATRMINWYLIVATFVSWLGLGLVFGFGFCLFTDIQSRIRRRLGAGEPMESFMKDVLDRVTGRDLNPVHVEIGTQIVFYFSAIASFYVNFAHRWF